MDWLTYSVADFIPFTQEIYLRLIERVNATTGLWRYPLALLPLAVIGLARGGRFGWANILLALAWVFCGTFFLRRFYSELNWAAPQMAWAFYGQAILLLASSRFAFVKPPSNSVTTVVGAVVIVIGITWPLVTAVWRTAWRQSEFFAVQPDPTALFCLGFLLLYARRRWLPVLILVPSVWCLTSALTLGVLQLKQSLILYAVVSLCWLALVAQWLLILLHSKIPPASD